MPEPRNSSAAGYGSGGVGRPGLAGLLRGATSRTILEDAPGKSGARLERLVIGGQPYVLKRLDLADDWTMRASGWPRTRIANGHWRRHQVRQRRAVTSWGWVGPIG